MSATVIRLDAIEPRRRRVAIGKFDGMHLGHRAVACGCDTVCTFHPHPEAVLNPDGAPPLLTDLDRRAELAGALGVVELVVLPFDDEMRARSPESFVADILLERLGAVGVRVGASFRFGHRARGTPAMLAAEPRLRVRVVEPVMAAGAAISSTRIRALVAAGAVAEAGELLGAPYALDCELAAADGERLELEVAPGLATPADGRYAGWASVPEGGMARTPCTLLIRGDTVSAHLGDAPSRGPGRPQFVRVELLERLAPAAVVTTRARRRRLLFSEG